MDIYVNVVNQKLHITTNIKSLVAGTQQFIRFVFNLSDEWDGLVPFAQFTQNGSSYNVYLDSNNSCYLPGEIVAGTFTLMLYGSAGQVRGTTNVITITVDDNLLVADAQSTEITQSLYDQLCDMVSAVLDISENADYAALIQNQVSEVLAEYLENGDFAALSLSDGSVTKAKLSSAVQATLDKADNADNVYWKKNLSETATPTSGSWEERYDPNGYSQDVFNFAISQDTGTVSRLRGTAASGNYTFTFTDKNAVPADHTYSGIDNTFQGVYNYATSYAESYTDGKFSQYSPINIEVVTEQQLESLMTGAGAANTFYLVSRDNSSGYYNYEKYWYVDGHWDTFGASSTVIVSDLEDVDDPTEDTDYIVGEEGSYQYYKYIDGEWELIAGGGFQIVDCHTNISGSGSTLPDTSKYSSGDYFLKTDTMRLYQLSSLDGQWELLESPSVIPSPSEMIDYYVKVENNDFGHFKYIENTFKQIGSNAYTKDEIDDMVVDINSDVSDIASDVSALQSTIENMGNMVADVTVSENDSTQLTVTYADGTSSDIAPDSSFNIDGTAYNIDDDSTLHFYNGATELTDLAVQITGGGGGGGAVTGGTASITRVTGSNVQCVYGDSCVIEYAVVASDAGGDAVGSGTGTLYINNVSVYSGFTVYTSEIGASNTIDVGEYLSVGSNAVKIGVSVDTGGETNTVATKTWTVNAINMYLDWNYTDSQVNTSAVTDYYTPYGALNKNIYTFLDVDPIGFNPQIVTSLPVAAEAESGVNYFLYENNEYTHYVFNESTSSYSIGNGALLNVTTTTRSGVQQALTIPMQSHGSHTVVRYIDGTVNGVTIKTAQQVHDMVFVVAGQTAPIIATSFNTASMTQYNTVRIPIVVYDPANTSTTVVLRENGTVVSTWTGVDRTVHYWNYSPTTYGTKTLTIACGTTTKTITIEVEELDIDEAEVTGYDFRFKASELATNAAVQAWSASYTPVGESTQQVVDITFSNNFDWVNGGLHTEEDEDGHLRQYFCVRAGTTMTFNYPLFGNYYDPKQYGKNFKFIFKAVNCRTYDASVLTCMDSSNGNNGVGLVMTANEAVMTTVNESLDTKYCKDTYIEFETNIHPMSEYRYLQFWMDGSHDRNILYSSDDSMQQVSPVGITVGSPNCDVYIYMMKAYPTYLTNNNELSNFIMDAPNAYEMVDRYNRNDILNASGEVDYTKLAAQNPDLRVLLLDLNRMSTGKKDNVVAYTVRQIYNSGGSSHCFTINNACVTIQGTSSVGYLESAGNVDINFKYGRNFTSDNVEYTTSSIAFDDGTTSTSGYAMTSNSIPVDYLNVKLNVASSENANNACIADWYNEYQPWRSPARKKNDKARDTIEFTPGVIFIRDRSGNLFSDTNGYHMYGICDIGNSKKNTKVFHDTTNPLACCIEVANNTSLPCLMSSKTYTWNSDDEATVMEYDAESGTMKAQKVFEFRYVNDDTVSLAESAWDRFVAFMHDYNPNLATGNSLGTSVTFGNYRFKGTGTFDTSDYDSDDYDVVYLYGYGLPATYGYAAANYVTNTTNGATCYYYINYTNNYIYSSNGTAWTAIEELTWTADTTNVLAGTTIGTYAGTYTTDSFNYRMAYLLEHCEEYMVMDPVIYHFIFIESYLMTDNVAKNTFWSSDDLVHWEPSKDYDNDTAIGNDNVGGLSFTYGLETDDTVGSSYVFNAHDAAWITFARNLFDACQTMYRNRESAGCFNTTNFLKKLQDWQDTRPERVWVADTQRKYLRPYEDNGTETYIPMLAGRKIHQREQVKTYNAYYYASKYVSNLCTTQNIMVRGNSGDFSSNTCTMSMYINCYIVVASTGQNVISKVKATRGVQYSLSFESVGTLGETELYFCSAPMIVSLGGLARLYMKQSNFAMGTSLQSLEIGSTTTGYSNTNLTEVGLGNNTMLEYLDIRNCPNATGALDLSGCISLKEIYLDNTSFTGITFAKAGLLETAHLDSPTVLIMRELAYLEDLTIINPARLVTLRVENCEFDNATEITIAGTTTTHGDKDLILTLIDASTNLSRVRFYGIDWILASNSTLESLYRMAGIDDDGYDTAKSVLAGDVYVPTMRQSSLTKYNTAWPYLTVTYDSMVTQYLATFMNANGDPIYDVNGNPYTQWVDAGSSPYNPITMGYTITVSDAGSPTVNEYDPSSYDGDYYLDTLTGYIYLSNGTTWSVAEEADILAPTMASDAQYIYTFSGWDDISSAMNFARTITAQYSTTARTYTVKFYRDPSTLLRTVTGVPYGGCVDYADTDTIVGYGAGTPVNNGYTAASNSGKYYQDMSTGTIYYSNGSNWTSVTYLTDVANPTWTTDETSRTFRVFKGWDKNTGHVASDVNVYAQWITTNGSLPSVSTDMSDMNVAQIYGICQAGLQSTYFEDLDTTTITLGHDYNFSNVESLTIGPKYYSDSTETTMSLPGITVDQFVSGGYYFDGTTYYQTNLELFDEDAPTCTIAIDFDMIGSTAGQTLISTNNGTTINFRIYNTGSAILLQWGDKEAYVGFPGCRDIVVLRHIKGSKSLYVYSAGYTNGTADRFSPDITRTLLTRTTDIVSENITLGAVNYHTVSNTYRNMGKCHIHWMKIWYDDLGDVNAYNLASWCHEQIPMEYWGTGKYEIDDGSGNTSNASFIANCAPAKRGYWMNSSSTNSGGWNSSLMRTFLNNRLYKALPTEWQSLVKKVQINATSGSQSTSIITSSDKLYLASYREVGGSGAGYNDEIGVDISSPNIPWFAAQTSSATVSAYNTANAQRLKWRGRIRTYALGDGNTTAYDGTPYIYSTTGGTEPAAYFSTNIAPGSIWINASDSGRGYIFVSQDELDQYGLTASVAASSTYAAGGWVGANVWWERSPYLTGSTYFVCVGAIGNRDYTNYAYYVGGPVFGLSI